MRAGHNRGEGWRDDCAQAWCVLVQVAGTVGQKLEAGKVTEMTIGSSTVTVRCKVSVWSGLAHSSLLTFSFLW